MNVQVNLWKSIKKRFISSGEGLFIDVFWNTLLLGSLTLPFGIQPSSLLFIIAMASGFLGMCIKRKFSLEKRNLPFLSFPILLCIMSLSLCYSYDVRQGVKLLTRLLPFLFFPIIIMCMEITIKNGRKVANAFLIGVVTTFLINLIWAFYSSLNWTQNSFDFNTAIKEGVGLSESIRNGGNHFFGGDFSIFVHPSYIGLYALVIGIYVLKSTFVKKIKVILLALLVVYLFLLSSKAALLLMMIISPIFLWKRTSLKKYGRFLIPAIIGIFCLVLFNPRMNEGIRRIQNFEMEQDHRYTTSSVSRVLSWKAALELIAEAPFFGYGTGDANTELLIKYLKADYLTNAKFEYNAHNQYFQTTLQVGILGLLFLILPLIQIGIREKNVYIWAMLIVLAGSLLFESMLVRYNGIVFYAIIIPFLLRKEKLI